MARPVRIFQLAKELNISHTEIVSFLKNKGIVVGSHMSPVDDDAHALIMDEFAKDKENVDRYRKEQVRREIHDTRVKAEQLAHKKVVILSLEDQRALEKEEKEKAAEKAKQDQKKAKQKQAEEKAKKDKEKEKKKEAQAKPKRKLRRIDLSSIESQVGQKQRKPIEKPGDKKPHVAKTTDQKVKATMAKMQTKTKKKVYKKEKVSEEIESEQKRTNISIAEFSSVEDLGKIFNVSSSEIIQKCMALGVLATINQRLDWEVIELLAEEYDMVAEKISDIGEELYSFKESEEDLAHAIERAPVVTVMGHVDHGKTAILDAIRETDVVSEEAGGITQAIGAHQVEHDGKKITFLDTPGHEAFTSMRARGAQITDIVILVVSADEGIKPTTVEAINHAKDANVPIIVAINKIDTDRADPDRVKGELAQHDLQPEDWGGKTPTVLCSAKTGQGINDLLDSALILSEISELKSNQDRNAVATVIESNLDPSLGPVGSFVVNAGTLKVGDIFVCGVTSGKVKSMIDSHGNRLDEVGPSGAVQIAGLNDVPETGDILQVVDKESDARKLLVEMIEAREAQKKRGIGDLISRISEGKLAVLKAVLKADSLGSLEAIEASLAKMKTESGISTKLIHSSVGSISESDVMIAAASDGIVLGFNVSYSSHVEKIAQENGVQIRTYGVIYELLDEVEGLLEGMVEEEETETVTGHLEVKGVFFRKKSEQVVGGKVTDGYLKRVPFRLKRDDKEIGTGRITSLKRVEKDIKEAKEGSECGMRIDCNLQIEEGDVIEGYVKELKKKS